MSQKAYLALSFAVGLFSSLHSARAATPYYARLKDALVLQSKELLDSGRHDFYKVKAETPLEMVKKYIEAKYSRDPELAAEYVYKENALDLEQDTQSAGTFANDQALSIVEKNLSDEIESREQVLENFKRLQQMEGVVLGFDGFEQNGCAAPTPFVLVIDTVSGEVDGLDLYPCVE